jgi:hypothetical protein
MAGLVRFNFAFNCDATFNHSDLLGHYWVEADEVNTSCGMPVERSGCSRCADGGAVSQRRRHRQLWLTEAPTADGLLKIRVDLLHGCNKQTACALALLS